MARPPPPPVPGSRWALLLSRTPARIGLGVLLAAVLAGLGVLLLVRTAAAVRVTVQNFDLSRNPVSVTYDVVKPAADSVRCAVAAYGPQMQEVGRLDDILVGPARNGARTVTVTTRVPVSGPAATVEVLSCQRDGGA